jgi:hypothetical protein
VSETLPAPLKTVCRVAGVSRSAACEQRHRRRVSADVVPARRRPGPVGALSDAELLVEIRRDPRRVAVPRRGPPRGVGAAASDARYPHQPQARAQTDQGSRAAGADAAGAQAADADRCCESRGRCGEPVETGAGTSRNGPRPTGESSTSWTRSRRSRSEPSSEVGDAACGERVVITASIEDAGPGSTIPPPAR